MRQPPREIAASAMTSASAGPRQLAATERFDLPAKGRMVVWIQPDLNVGAAGRHLQRFATSVSVISGCA